MSGYMIGNFFVYAIVNAFTPGPGNILALNTVASYGIKKGTPLFLGIFTGYYVVQILCAVFVFGINAFLSSVLGIMKYIGAAYILFLALHIAVSKPAEETADRSVSFWKGFMLQFVNVKIYMFGITALTGYVTDYSTSLWILLMFEMIVATIGTIATSAWIGMGVLIQNCYKKHFRIANIFLALILLECVYSILK
ncbi:MAG: LysE family transporter [Oscillospiraceae bacterium]|nr:LysE family transporter [Oscillospiraceae bacterium]